MDGLNPEWVGGMAAVMTTFAYLPQAVKVLRTRDTHSISLGMYAMMATGVALWLVYGLLLGKPSIIIANGLTLGLAILILIMKIRLG